MTEPLVSVKMITYNHAPYIAQAIEGVLMQKTDFPFELVIGEDCSTDGTRQIVFDYANRYPDIIRLVTSDSNVGMTENGNRTAKACRGKYIAFCEGDDYWHRDDKLQIQVDYLETHPKCGLVCSDYDINNLYRQYVVKNHGRRTGKTAIQQPQINDILAGKTCVRTVTAVARRDLVERVKQSDPYLFGGHFKMGDLQLWVELRKVSIIHVLNDSLATYQLLDESATRSKDEIKRLSFWLSAAELHIYLCDKHGLSKSIKEMHVKRMRRILLKLAFLEKRPSLAKEVKRQHPQLDIKEKIWYYGATISWARPFVLLMKKLFQRKII